jgi:hypothetical protein
VLSGNAKVTRVQNRYAFAELEGRSVFIHRSVFVDEDDFDQLQEGDTVYIDNLQPNDRGPGFRATFAELVSE